MPPAHLRVGQRLDEWPRALKPGTFDDRRRKNSSGGPVEPPPLLHPNMAKVYSRKINALYAALQSDEGRPTAADLLRTLIDRIVLEPADGKLDILLKGDIAGILSFASAEKELPATGVRGGQVPMVAGARNQRCLQLDCAVL